MSCYPLRLAAFFIAVTLVAVTEAAEALPTDPRVRSGQLENGLTWILRPHANPADKLALLLHVKAGSLNEGEDQAGVARFVEHLVFSGTENFPPGAVTAWLERVGLTPGDDFNASTSFDQTQYSLFLPDTAPEHVEQGLMVLADFAFRAVFPEAEIGKERAAMLEELRVGRSVDERVRDELFARLFPGSRLAAHRPLGRPESIQRATRAELLDFYRAWYRPERMTLILVGDVDWDALRPLVEELFGQYRPGTPARPDAGPAFKLPTQPRAIIITDPEYAGLEAAVASIRPGRPPTTTVEQKRIEIGERLVSWIVQRRLAERITRGDAGFHAPAVRTANFMHAAVLANVSAFGEAQDWAKIIDGLVTEVVRARQFGFTARELELAKTKLLAAAEAAVRTEPNRPARPLLFALATAVNDDVPLLSAQQELDLLKRLLPAIGLDDLRSAFVEDFTPESFAYVLQMPDQQDVRVPGAADVLAAAEAARAQKLDPPPDAERPRELLAAEPAPGRAVETTTEAELGITHAWLENGARVHHRAMDDPKDSVLFSVCLSGGQIEETAENAGVTEVAVLPFEHPATQRLNSLEIADQMAGKSIRLQADAADDTFVVRLSGAPRDLEAGLRLLHALLTEAKLEENVFRAWQQRARQQLTDLQKEPTFQAGAALRDLLGGGDPRQQFPTPQRVEKQTIAAAEAWLARLCRAAPLEVAVVGDVQLEQVLPLVEQYIGSLPARPRTAVHLDRLRKLQRGPGPYVARVEVPSEAAKAMVLFGCVGSDARNVRDSRALQLAAGILERRLAQRLRDDPTLAGMLRVGSDAGTAYQDSGAFLAGGTCDPRRVDEVSRLVADALAAFAESGPSAQELDHASKQAIGNLETAQKTLGYWCVLLQKLELRDTDLEKEKTFRQDFEAFTPATLRDIFRSYYVPQRQFRVVAVPVPPSQPQGSAPSSPASQPRP